MERETDAMTSTKPYLIRAIYEWILDNEMTPHLVVDTRRPGVMVPKEYVEDGRLVLNLSPSAVRGLVMGNDRIELNARFGGVARDVILPIEAVLGIFTRENGQGMVFPERAEEPLAEGTEVEPERADEPFAGPTPVPRRETAPLKPVRRSTKATPPPTDKSPSGKGKGKGGPTLKVVK